MRFIFVSFLLITLLGCNEPEKTTANSIRPIMWTEVSSSSLDQVRTLSGIVAPVEATKLSFEVNGKIEKINVHLGDDVTKGQALAQLNQRSFKLGLQSAKAKYEQSKASFSDARNSYLRYEKLIKQGVVSQSGFDNAKANFDASKSAVDVAKAQLDIAAKNLEDSTLLAPYNGIITKQLFEPSQQVAAGQSVFEIEGKHGLEVNVMVPETLIRELTRDTLLSISFPVIPSLKMEGKITEIGTRAESANAFPVTVVLQSDNSLLRAGMTAEVKFAFEGVGRTGHTGAVMRIPVTALRAGINQKTYVFVYDTEQQVVIKTQVQTENVLENEVYISAGINEGDIIATAGVAFLRDGQKVTLLDTKTQRFN
ncbi:efflux RND transporter periplasmic adaptor subunit [Litorilituus lipolyticus]|uniref:Efflux RND transporter periplasmic adaptor subunit n=1 Tax=Litorilituus lipolyticus TaxID=2491017 RepID=A0A502L855_9GAMM|nr:efflux RND transporter periplasmic adaptor subunit [Litorilituus lipolyticus]TPH18501.1 efflux RND transporter periplasmic adaptor subunit [Litorilituus lipolyticus]